MAQQDGYSRYGYPVKVWVITHRHLQWQEDQPALGYMKIARIDWYGADIVTSLWVPVETMRAATRNKAKAQAVAHFARQEFRREARSHLSASVPPDHLTESFTETISFPQGV